MKTYEIRLIDIGRSKHTQLFIKDFENIEYASRFAYEECHKHLLSRNVSLDPVEEDEELWNVYAGFHKVGEVRIKER